MNGVARPGSQRRTAVLAAVAVIVVGGVVCALWILGLAESTRLVPASSAVRFNTGLCFVLGGTSLLLALGRRPRWALAAIAPMVVLAGLTLLEYLLGWNLAVDDLFIPAVTRPYAGRMAPNTAVALLVAALGLATLVPARTRIWALSISTMLAALTVALAGVAALGYAVDLTAAFEWAGFTRMALLTAITLVVLGVGIFVATREVGRIASWVEQPWLASSVGVGAAGLGLLASHALGVEAPELPAGVIEALDAAAIVFAILLAGTVAQARHMRLLTLRLADANRRQAEQSAEIADLYENAPCGYHSLDAQARILRINRTELAWLGYERDELVGRRTLPELLAPASRELYVAQFERLKAGEAMRDLQLEMVRKDGSTLPVALSASAVCDASGRFHHSRGTVADDSERRRFAQALRDSEHRLQVLIDNVQTAGVVHATDSSIEFANPRAAEVLGLTREQMQGRTAIDPAWHFVREDGSPMPVAEYPVTRVIGSGQALRDYVVGIHFAAPRPVRWALVDAVPVIGEDGRVRQVIVSFIDISERQQHKQHLEQLAATDALTGLATRRRLLELAGQELARARRTGLPLGVVMCDVDRFKSINDRFGHDTGDRVLRGIGEVLQAQLREVDLAARWGGEEFCVLLPETDARAAVEVAQRLRVAVERASLTAADGSPLAVTASFGVTVSTPEVDDIHRLVAAADQAMYQAKRAGRNRVREAPADAGVVEAAAMRTGPDAAGA
jgi:diguanylate cyclase (GGDEF)-like protein/PAS domain S-box-containing protein